MAWTLYKRREVWWAVQTVRGVRERRTTRCGDKKAARLVVDGWERAAADPRHHAAYTTTLGVALMQLVADRTARGRAKGTLSMYDQKSAHLARLLGQDTMLADIGAPEVDAYLERRVAEGASRNTISKEMNALRGALRIARRRGQYNREPGEVMPIGWSSGYTPRKTFLTQEQVGALMVEVARDLRGTKNPQPRPDRAAHVAFIVATGARWSESLRAERGDADIEARRVFMRGTKTDASDATIAVSPAVVPLLRMALLGAPGAVVLFRRWASVRRDLAMACKRAGIPSVTPNDLRRSAATWLVQAGVSIFAVSKVLRHADTRMVEAVYGQLPVADLGRMLDASAVSTACPTPDHSGDQGDHGNSPSPSNAEETSESGAQGRNRTVDTRIFNPDHVSTKYRAKPHGVVRCVSQVCPGLDAEPPPRSFGALLDGSLTLGAAS